MKEFFDLSGKVAMVTGTSGNLGPIWVDLLEDMGASVFAIDLPEYNVTKRGELLLAKKRCIDNFGMPYIIVNNAGIDNPPGSNASFFGNWEKILEVNLGGCINMTEIFIDDMILNGGGNIVNIGSLLGFVAADHRNYPEGFDKPCGYGASKAAMWNFTRNCQTRYTQHGVIVNMLALAGVEGNQAQSFKDKYLRNMPLGRMLIKEDFEKEFLCCVTARSPYGFPIFVEGGYTAY